MKAPKYFRLLCLGRLVAPPQGMAGRLTRDAVLMAGSAAERYSAAAVALCNVSKCLLWSPRTAPAAAIVREEMRIHGRLCAGRIRERAAMDAARAVHKAGADISNAARERICELSTDERVRVFCENEQYRFAITGGGW